MVLKNTKASLWATHGKSLVGMIQNRTAALAVSSALCAVPLVSADAVFLAETASAQGVVDALAERRTSNPDAKLLLRADELIYNQDSQTVSAAGSVQVDYDGNKLVADRLDYDQRTGKLVAIGNVELVETSGNRIFADKIDVTDDFRDGFVDTLRIETLDQTRFAANSAERVGGTRTIFNQGVYTACTVCISKKSKAPLWQIKAKRIILDGETKTVHYEDASFELFGRPIAYLARFSHADPSVKRLSGWLFPKPGYSTKLGFHLKNSYFWALAPNYDLTTSITGYSKQGFLGEAEWRHRLENGTYTFKIAGIHQFNPDEFTPGTIDAREDNRVMAATTGKFEINPSWTFGWDILAQSDRTFSETYNIEGYTENRITSEVYLKGLDGRSYFDLHAYRFVVQDESDLQDQQAVVHPILDYNFVAEQPIFGGQFSLNTNFTSLTRIKLDAKDYVFGGANTTRYDGLDGNYNRLTLDAEWKRTITNSVGMHFTPSLTLRGDAFWLDGDRALTDARFEGRFETDTNVFRALPTFGLEYRWPILVSDGANSHIFEPIAQLLVRPNLDYSGVFANEDAQSLVFDTTNLFSHNKFSGYDRIESGTRANIGLRYSGQIGNDITLSGLIGQSFHLAGDNPFRRPDVAQIGAESGLETDRSDFVTMAGVQWSNGLRFETRARFDESTFETRRIDTAASYNDSKLSIAGGYSFIEAQPQLGEFDDRHQINAAASYKLEDGWKIFGSMNYDIENSKFLKNSIGIGFECDCISLALEFSQDNTTIREVDKKISLRIGLRTLGGFETSQRLDNF